MQKTCLHENTDLSCVFCSLSIKWSAILQNHDRVRRGTASRQGLWKTSRMFIVQGYHKTSFQAGLVAGRVDVVQLMKVEPIRQEARMGRAG